MHYRVRKEWETANKLWAEAYMPRALAFQQDKKLVSAEGEKTQGPPAEKEQPLPSLSPALRSDTPLDSRRSYVSVEAPRPTPKPRRKGPEKGSSKPTPRPREGPEEGSSKPTPRPREGPEEGRPKPTLRPRQRSQRHEQAEKSETLGLINALKNTVETLPKELEMERAALKKLLDEVITKRKERKRVSAHPPGKQGVVEASQGNVDEGVLQLVSQILLAAMDKTLGNQS